MAQNYEIEVQAQPSIYAPQERTMRIYFSEPEKGMDQNTGMLLLLAGYGGNATSNVFAKMRRQFADDYNLLTVQCDYFGYEYMQNNIRTEITQEMLEDVLTDAERELLQLDYDKYEHILKGKIFRQIVELDETPEHFNDMGLMQAMDNLRAVKVVMDIAKDNGYEVHPDRVYAYGFSHGAYLAYLCNVFWPERFTAIIDNSAYLSPYYLEVPRKVICMEAGLRIDQIISYKALEYIQDEEILSLPQLYQQFENQAQIISYVGEKDHMTSPEDKKAFLNQVENAKFEMVTQSRVDKVCFHNTDHGMGADFMELFRYTYAKYLASDMKKKRNKKAALEYRTVEYETSKFRYMVSWEEGIPVLTRVPKD